MDIRLKEYLNDGSDWQSQAVLAYLRRFESSNLNAEFDIDHCVYLPKYYLKVGRIDNFREQGHVYELLESHGEPICYFWVCQYRSTDDLCVRFFNQQGNGAYTPSVMAGMPEKNEWYIDKSFDYGDIVQAGKFIFFILKQKIQEFENNKP